MKLIAIFFCLIVTTQSWFKFKKIPEWFKTKPSIDFSFKYYAQKFKIDIEGDLYNKRLEIFKTNLDLIEEHNKNPEKSYRLKITPLSFLDDEERASYLGV